MSTFLFVITSMLVALMVIHLYVHFKQK